MENTLEISLVSQRDNEEQRNIVAYGVWTATSPYKFADIRISQETRRAEPDTNIYQGQLQ